MNRRRLRGRAPLPIVVFAAILTFAIPTRSAGQTPARNSAVVEEWVQQALAGGFSRADALLGSDVTLHDVSGTTAGTRREFVDLLEREVQLAGGLQLRQIEVFGERDKVCVIYAAEGDDGPVSAVRFYRVVDDRVVEAWRGPTAAVRWAWEPQLDGDLDRESNQRVFARWYEDVYASGDWQLVPDLIGPTFVRHEDREFSMGPEEYRDRLVQMFDGPVRLDYEVVAGGDKVAVIARVPDGRGFLQAWRVRGGRLVESWWAPGLAAW